jgi:superfamily I DNA/RNA helicase
LRFVGDVKQYFGRNSIQILRAAQPSRCGIRLARRAFQGCPSSQTPLCAAALIETWLRGGIDIGGRRQRVKPGDIALLYPRKRAGAAVTALHDRLNGFTRAVLPAGDKPTGTLRDEAVKILPIHSARGLQFRIVLLLWADLLPSRFTAGDDGSDRDLLYVAMTRAEDMLVVLHSGSSAYVEALYRALGMAPAP